MHLRKDGTTFPVLIDITVVRDEDGNVLYRVANVLDITERKQTEEALINSQKLASLGTLAAGVAHEINSPLQIITGTSESMTRRFREGHIEEERMLRNVENINRSAWRVANIVKSLLAYARTGVEQVEPHDLSEIVRYTVLLIEHQLRSWSTIYVNSDLAADLPPMHCERNNISQVLINLLNNARDAMPRGGEINIQTRYDRQKERLVLQVSDTGTGIPGEIQGQIFDPFFTTKPIGKGTGLGLSIVFGIVEAHGGEIEVDSTPGAGAMFRIYFPQKPPEREAGEQISAAGRYDDVNNI